MADLLAQGLAWLDDQRHQHMTRPVTIRRGADRIDLDATPGRMEFEQSDQSGFLTKTQSAEWVVRTADFTFGGEPSEPQVGDQIIDGPLEYEVMAPSGEQAFSYTDASRTSMRIHSKLVGVRQ